MFIPQYRVQKFIRRLLRDGDADDGRYFALLTRRNPNDKSPRKRQVLLTDGSAMFDVTGLTLAILPHEAADAAPAMYLYCWPRVGTTKQPTAEELWNYWDTWTAVPDGVFLKPTRTIKLDGIKGDIFRLISDVSAQKLESLREDGTIAIAHRYVKLLADTIDDLEHSAQLDISLPDERIRLRYEGQPLALVMPLRTVANPITVRHTETETIVG